MKTYPDNILSLITERELQEDVIELAKLFGWKGIYHTWRSDRSEPGYPDLTMFHPEQKRIIWVECKRQNGKTTPSQIAYGELIKACGGEYYLWYPADWLDGTVEKVLH